METIREMAFDKDVPGAEGKFTVMDKEGSPIAVADCVVVNDSSEYEPTKLTDVQYEVVRGQNNVVVVVEELELPEDHW